MKKLKNESQQIRAGLLGAQKASDIRVSNPEGIFVTRHPKETSALITQILKCIIIITYYF